MSFDAKSHRVNQSVFARALHRHWWLRYGTCSHTRAMMHRPFIASSITTLRAMSKKTRALSHLLILYHLYTGAELRMCRKYRQSQVLSITLLSSTVTFIALRSWETGESSDEMMKCTECDMNGGGSPVPAAHSITKCSSDSANVNAQSFKHSIRQFYWTALSCRSELLSRSLNQLITRNKFSLTGEDISCAHERKTATGGCLGFHFITLRRCPSSLECFARTWRGDNFHSGDGTTARHVTDHSLEEVNIHPAAQHSLLLSRSWSRGTVIHPLKLTPAIQMVRRYHHLQAHHASGVSLDIDSSSTTSNRVQLMDCSKRVNRIPINKQTLEALTHELSESKHLTGTADNIWGKVEAGTGDAWRTENRRTQTSLQSNQLMHRCHSLHWHTSPEVYFLAIRSNYTGQSASTL